MRSAFICAFLLACLQAAASPAEFKEVPTVAVLYFENATGVDHLSWLPKGFSDMLIRDLSATGRLKIVSRQEVEHAEATYRDLKTTAYANKTVALRLGKILGTSHVIAGRFARRDTDLIIEIKLYDLKQQRQTVWRQVEGTSEDFAFLEKQTALKIIDILDVRLSDREMIEFLQIPTRSHKAIAYYSMGLDALDKEDRELARSYFQTSLDADKYFRLAINAISGMAFVLSGKAVLRAEVAETAVLGVSSVRTVPELLELARTNAFDFLIGEPSTTPVESDTMTVNVKVPLSFSVRPDYVNLWLYAIRRIAHDTAAPASRKMTFVRQDIFDNPVSLSVPGVIADEWLTGWKNLKMRLVFQNKDGAALFESPKVPVLPLYIGNAEAEFEGQPSVYWKIDTAFDIGRVPKHFFEEPLEVTLEVER